ncbi:MAG: nitrilase, partial [Calditrichaeota bacterium]
NQFVTKDTYPADLLQLPELQQRRDPLCRGGSAIVDPLGNYVAGPLYDEEGVLFAQLPLQKIVEARFDFDPAGHYQREDVFVFQLKE